MLTKISTENMEILKRLKEASSCYNSEQFKDDFERKEKLFQNVCTRPLALDYKKHLETELHL